MPLSLDVEILRALLDRLIPADEFPSACEAGVEGYVIGQLNGDCATEAEAIAAGLSQLDAEAGAVFSGKRFTALAASEQDQILSALERGASATAWPKQISAAGFFDRMVHLAHEGFYADPDNAGNRDAVSWTMLRYNPRTPANEGGQQRR